MNVTTILGLSMTATTLMLVACGGTDSSEPTTEAEQHVEASCIASLKDPIGSQAWIDGVEKCIGAPPAASTVPSVPSTAVPTTPTPVPDAGSVPPSSTGTGTSSNCSTSTSCFNGLCMCTAGPAKGSACDGSQTSGANSCSVLCKVCQ